MKLKLTAKIDDLQTQLDDLTKAIADLHAEVAELQKQMKRAGENREIANKDFQLTVADQKATQKILTASLNVLKGFYEKYSLLQGKQAAEKQPQFKKYEK